MKFTGPGQKALRMGRVTVPGHAYLITAVCVGRQPVFTQMGLARVAVSVFESPATWPSAELLAWVLMPDHWHGLVVPDGTESIGRVMQRAKASVTRELRRKYPNIPAPWQPGFHDHGLRRQESVPEAVRYLLDNPVRAGLVTQWDQWPYTGGRYAMDYPFA